MKLKINIKIFEKSLQVSKVCVYLHRQSRQIKKRKKMENLNLILNNSQSETLKSVINELNTESVKYTQDPLISNGGEIIGYEFYFEYMPVGLIFSLGSLFGKSILKN